MAFTTTTGAGGTSLIGTSGVDVQTVAGSSFPLYLGAQGDKDVIAFTTAPVASFTGKLGDGDDTVSVAAAADFSKSTLDADKGKDTIALTGDFDSSTLRGGEGNDTLTVTEAVGSFVNGNAGKDTITLAGKLDKSTVLGGADADTFTVNDITVKGGSKINGNKGDDTITPSITSTAMSSSTIFGGEGNDTISGIGSSVALILSGDKGADTITGGTAADTLYGGEGKDTISADDAIGATVDIITTGADADTVKFLGNTGGGATVAIGVTTDQITDFTVAEDKVSFATAGAVSLYNKATNYGTSALTDGTIFVISGTISSGVFTYKAITDGGFDTAIVYGDGAANGGFEAAENSVLLKGVLANTITASNIVFA